MKKLVIASVITLIFLSILHKTFDSDSLLFGSKIGNMTEYVPRLGYPLENHYVETEDGYILNLHRIPHGINTSDSSRPPVLLMHGLLSSSMDWIMPGPNKSLGLILADAGYDVWLGNNRGNTYSRNHTAWDADRDKERFFNYSYHEIGVYDLPAMIDEVLSVTGHSKLTYIGFSEGFTSFLVMGSIKPQYNNKILLMNALAPVTNMFDVTSIPINLTARYSLVLQDYQLSILSNFPAGMSLKQIIHYIQGSLQGTFAAFDYGPNGNLAQYGQITPPSYNLSEVSSPMAIYYSESDNLVNSRTLLETVVPQLPNMLEIFHVPYPNFNHLDYLWARNMTILLQKVIKNVNKANKRFPKTMSSLKK
ncbi:lipase 1-like isoform X2 [Rhynchophorus ferrugineus]|uniref:lipase 1-like isoform X2 n=1 Tax=Rhynchophorus ferrugineus TaxID=354439 RepID=UPI003FCDFE1E